MMGGSSSNLNRAKDLSASIGQGVPRLVHSLDGRVIRCMSCIAAAEADIEPAPQREHAHSMIVGASRDPAGDRAKLVRGLDDQSTGFPDQLVYHNTEDGMMASLVPGLPAGFAAQHPWQVVWAGGNRWFVGAGTITARSQAPEKVVEIEATVLSIDSGWIGVSINWDIRATNDCRLESAMLLAVDTLPASGVQFSYDDGGNPVWTSGAIFHPIAHVAKPLPTRGRPLVQQSATGNFIFGTPGFPVGPFGPRALYF